MFLPLVRVRPSGWFGNGTPGGPAGWPARSFIPSEWGFPLCSLLHLLGGWMPIPANTSPLSYKCHPHYHVKQTRATVLGPGVHDLSSWFTQMVCGHGFRISELEKTRYLTSPSTIPKNFLWWWKWFVICAINMVATGHMCTLNLTGVTEKANFSLI